MLAVSSTYCVPSLPVTLKIALVVMPASFAAYTIGSTLTCVVAPPPTFSSVSRTLLIVDSLSLSVKRATSSFVGDTGSEPSLDEAVFGTSGCIPSATPIRLRCSLSVSLPNAIVLPFCVLALAASSSEFDSSPRCAS
ncbi:hypothetical protein BCO37747_07931 [Burkholderia contaminans]|nr:hypothetical protein BCO23253_06866 [Burkholderia contaminans]VWD65096.1 hypothetical protein BCO37747_07931 [Burkholderia contaminans]